MFVGKRCVLKKEMILFLVSCLFCVSAACPAATAEKSGKCQFKNEILSIGESRWVPDPVLEADPLVGRDWNGYRVECRSTVRVTLSDGTAGSVITKQVPVLVLTELSDSNHIMVTNEYSKHKNNRGL